MGFFDGLAGALVSGASALIGGQANARSAEAAAQRNADLQREFAQNGIRWRVEDAKAAGLHPLAALGTSGASASPVFTATDSGLAQAGQNLGRAIASRKTAEERAYDEAVQAYNLENQLLQNELLSAQIAESKSRAKNDTMRTQQSVVNDMARNAIASNARLLHQPGNPPPMPTDFTSPPETAARSMGLSVYPTGEVVREVSAIPTSLPGNPGVQAGVPPRDRFVAVAPGVVTRLPTESVQDYYSDNLLASLSYDIFNRVFGFLGNYSPDMMSKYHPPITDEMRERGEAWLYNPITNEYTITKVPDDRLINLGGFNFRNNIPSRESGERYYRFLERVKNNGRWRYRD